MQFIICNITLSPLRALATIPQNLDNLHVFPTDEYPWYASVFDLDIITDHLPTTSFFIDYVEKRLKFRNKDTDVPVFEELQFLSLYLRNLDFSELKSNAYFQSVNLLDPFEFHYLLGKEKLKLSLNGDLLDLIRKVEGLSSDDSIDVVLNILSVNPRQKEYLIRRVDEKIRRFRKDKKPHCCSLKFDPLDFGLTFYVKSIALSDERLIAICHIARKKYRTSRWIGLEYVQSNEKGFINRVYISTDDNLSGKDRLHNLSDTNLNF